MHEGLHLSLHCLHRHFQSQYAYESSESQDVQPMDGCMLKPENRHEISLFSPKKVALHFLVEVTMV